MKRLLLFIIAGVMMVTGCGDRIQPSVLNERTSAVGLLSETIQARIPSGDVVLVINPLGRDQANVRALQDETIALFRQALKGRSIRMVEPELIQGLSVSDLAARVRPGSTAPLSYMMISNSFEIITRDNPNATVLVSLVGMPDPGPFTNIPPVVLLLPDLRVFGDPESAIKAFTQEYILAAAVVVDGSVTLITKGNATDIIPMLNW